jgi:hypothetical protein
MAATINATPGAADANSYLTLQEAQSYAETELSASDWETATNDQRTRALITATRALDLLSYVGNRSTTTQALAWPRQGFTTGEKAYTSTEVPTEIKQAQWELALSLLKGTVISGAGAGSTSIIPGIPNSALQRVKLDVMEIEWKKEPNTYMHPIRAISPGLLNDLILNTPGSTIAVVRS